MRPWSFVVLPVALSTLGCAEQLQLLDRGPVGGVSPCSFWPPPPSSTTWIAERSPSVHPGPLSSVALELELSLREGGYDERGKWSPPRAETTSGNSPPLAIPLGALGFTPRRTEKF